MTLAQLAGLNPSGVICEILNEDGSLARLPDLIEYKKKHQLKLISIADLIEYRLTRDRLVQRVDTTPFASEYGNFELHRFHSILDDRMHLALSMGKLGADPTLVRVQRADLPADVFRAANPGIIRSTKPCVKLPRCRRRRTRLHRATTGSTPLPNHRENGSSGLRNRCPEILLALGLQKIRLLSGTNRKVVGLDGYGLQIVEQVDLSS